MEGGGGVPQFPSFHAKAQVLEIHKPEKHFKLCHNKKPLKVEVFARIYFSETEKCIGSGWGREK
jgi:hypothetical protein